MIGTNLGVAPQDSVSKLQSCERLVSVLLCASYRISVHYPLCPLMLLFLISNSETLFSFVFGALNTPPFGGCRLYPSSVPNVRKDLVALGFGLSVCFGQSSVLQLGQINLSVALLYGPLYSA